MEIKFSRKLVFTKKFFFFYIKYRTWDHRKHSTVHSREVFTQDKSGCFSNGKEYMGKTAPGKKIHYKEVFTNLGVHYERFHCTSISAAVDVGRYVIA